MWAHVPCPRRRRSRRTPAAGARCCCSAAAATMTSSLTSVGAVTSWAAAGARRSWARAKGRRSSSSSARRRRWRRRRALRRPSRLGSCCADSRCSADRSCRTARAPDTPAHSAARTHRDALHANCHHCLAILVTCNFLRHLWCESCGYWWYYSGRRPCWVFHSPSRYWPRVCTVICWMQDNWHLCWCGFVWRIIVKNR